MLSRSEAIGAGSRTRARGPPIAPIVLTDDGRIDVHELLTSYLRHSRSRGAVIRTSSEVRELIVENGRCRAVVTEAGTLTARWVVNAAGAWAGTIARMTDAANIPLQPRRRSIVTFAPPPNLSISGWPFLISEADLIYFAPESGGLLLSPMDQDPTAPCDAQPEDEVIAAAMERLRGLAPALVPTSLKRKWAGLRTFSPDSIPLVGEDPRIKGFFWLAGQQGFGIESSPAIGQIAADLDRARHHRSLRCFDSFAHALHSDLVISLSKIHRSVEVPDEPGPISRSIHSV